MGLTNMATANRATARAIFMQLKRSLMPILINSRFICPSNNAIEVMCMGDHCSPPVVAAKTSHFHVSFVLKRN
uniref:Uncharacterized protein n=1 Tax=Anguilla anguilla TaxID=7936 RepID=A0A0E9X1J1_ANGAN